MNDIERTYTSNLVAFCTALRERGVAISTDDTLAAAQALAEINPLERDEFYYGLRATLLHEPTQIAVFDELFEAYWDELADERFDDETPPDTDDVTVDEYVTEEGTGNEEETERVETEPLDDLDRSGRSSGDADDLGKFLERRSDERSSGSQDDCESEEIALEVGRQERSTHPTVAFEGDRLATEDLSLLVKELGSQLGTLQGFRRRIQPSGKIDLRQSLSLARERNPSDLPRIEKERSQTKICFFVDVSHSMLRNMQRELLLLFLFECMHQYTDVRIFMFDTDITEVTRHFQAADVTQTLSEMRRAQTEWGAGTTIGDCLARVLTTDPFVIDNDTVVVIVSDGWDAGDLDTLHEQMLELDRRSRTVIWFNPRAAAENFEPKVSGMATALPYTDHFFGFASMDDLRHIVTELRSRTSREAD